MRPSITAHGAAEPSLALTHCDKSLPSNNIIASDGASALVFPGVTTVTSGFQISVISGFIGIGETAGGVEEDCP